VTLTNTPIPIYQFKAERIADIPFEIVPIADLPPIATSPNPHRHMFYVIFWIMDGSGIHNIDFEPWSIVPNTLYFVTPGQVNFWSIEEQISGYVILFTSDFVATHILEQITLQSFDFYHHTAKQPLVHINEENAHIFNEICEKMLSEYASIDYGRFTILQSLLAILLIHAQRHHTKTTQPIAVSAGKQLISQYLQLVDEHFYNIQNIQEYAQILGITAGHLSDIAREQLGITPIQLLNKRITLESKRYLAHSELTIAQIGQQLHFDNPSYFTRFFKRETGVTPSNFRHQFRKKVHNPRS
jgi:AraC family transcriptional regulator, transcriptional activator of pobA